VKPAVRQEFVGTTEEQKTPNREKNSKREIDRETVRNNNVITDHSEPTLLLLYLLLKLLYSDIEI